MSSKHSNGALNEVELGEEAAEWLLRLDDADPDSDDEYPNETSRNEAFLRWLQATPNHLRVFLETLEAHRRLSQIDAQHLIRVESLLQRRADVIPLHKDPLPHAMQEHPAPVRRRKIQTWKRMVVDRFERLPLRGFAAAIVVCVLGAGAHEWLASYEIYVTDVGEQRSTKLEDGSFIYMNTDSRVEVDFSRAARRIRLVRGEALFVVERDSARPFTVTVGDATVRALGTQFNVRRYSEGAQVAVVEGVVQVTAQDERQGTSAEKLVAGEEAKVANGQISSQAQRSPGETLAWRQRRLMFRDARLIDVADEFNRYNRTKIRVEGDAAKEIMLSGIFDADRPQALILFAAQNAEVSVEPLGGDWVIRAR